tara:strand:- start:295 stop:2151 length:1857 start_codon:yes stop_codon:yes gene_type:complete
MDTLSNHLEEVIFCKENNKPSRNAKRSGTADFYILSELIKKLLLSNESNREVELEELDKYLNKFGHLLRFVSGVSEKSAMLITILRDGLDNVGYIRDDGTLSGLALDGGEYYDLSVISPNQIIDLMESIEEEYEVESVNREFFNLIDNVFSEMSDEEKKLPISLKEIVESNNEIKDFYFSTTLDYTVNLLSMTQHSKDMRDANLQPNPWIAFQYYWVPNKLLPEYKTTLLGKDLFEFVNSKPGLSYSKSGRIMGKLNPSNEPMKKAEKLKWLAISYVGSEFCNNVKDFEEFIVMVARFHDHHKNDVFRYWSNMFKKLVKEVSYTEITEYYEDKYKKVYESDLWGTSTKPGINKVINSLVDKVSKSGGPNTCGAISKFNISREINGVVFIAFTIYMKNRYGKVGWDKTIELISNKYISILEGDVYCEAKPSESWNSGKYPVWEALYKKYIGSSIEKRLKYVLSPMIEEVINNINKKKNDRYHESVLRTKSLKKHFNACSDNYVFSRITLFPLAVNGSFDEADTITVNFGNGNGLHWLHPNDDENMAKDGFLGLYQDNLSPELKEMDWTPYIDNNSTYWKLLLDRNQDKLKNIDKETTLYKRISKSTETLELLSELDLNI